MPASDRRLIHLTLADDPDVQTYSIGEGDARKVVLAARDQEKATKLLVIGNIAEDRAGDSWIPGGPSLYVSRVALALGAEVVLLTHVPDGYDMSVLDGMHVVSAGRTPAPRFDNRYDENGHRTQLLLAEGERITLADIGLALKQPGLDAIFVAPAMHEVATLPTTTLPLFFSLQGYFRIVDEAKRVNPDTAAWSRIEQVIRPGSHTFWSVEDAGSPAHASGVATALAGNGVFTAVTNGEQGSWFPRHNHSPGDCPFLWRDAIPTATTIDPTGAGDAFATAYCIRFLETGDEDEAELFALAAGSLAVERTGILAVPGRAAIETRAKQAGER